MRFMRLTPLLRKLQVLRKSRLKKLMVCVKTPLKKLRPFSHCFRFGIYLPEVEK